MKKFIDLVKQNKIKALGVLVVIALAFSFFGRGDDDSMLEVSVQEVGTKDLSSKVVADGVLTPETEVKLSANSSCMPVVAYNTLVFFCCVGYDA